MASLRSAHFQRIKIEQPVSNDSSLISIQGCILNADFDTVMPFDHLFEIIELMFAKIQNQIHSWYIRPFSPAVQRED